jgi:signal transduction histidine kinase
MPPDFNHVSLANSLSDLCKQFSKRTGIECLFSVEEDLPFREIRPENQLHIYRIVQEALTNVEKHSGSKKAAVFAHRLKDEGDAEGGGQHGGDILVCVSDEGRGIQQGQGNGEVVGFGMKTMLKRAELLGAKLNFESELDNGLMVRLELSGKR